VTQSEAHGEARSEARSETRSEAMTTGPELGGTRPVQIFHSFQGNRGFITVFTKTSIVYYPKKIISASLFRFNSVTIPHYSLSKSFAPNRLSPHSSRRLYGALPSRCKTQIV
jgi:hypothetical protein